MNLIKAIKTLHTREGKIPVKPVPKEGVKRFWYLFITHYDKIIFANILFILFCLPVITIPAAVCGLNRIIFNLYFDGSCEFWSDFWSEFKSAFKVSTRYIFIMILLILMIVLICFVYATSNVDYSSSMVGFIIAVVLALYTWVVLCYALIMQTIVVLPSRTIIKNAIILGYIEFKSNMLLLLIPAASTYLMLVFLPYTAPLLLLIWFAIAQMAIAAIVIEPLKRRIIKPSKVQYG